jgi:hypothetical protein
MRLFECQFEPQRIEISEKNSVFARFLDIARGDQGVDDGINTPTMGNTPASSQF